MGKMGNKKRVRFASEVIRKEKRKKRVRFASEVIHKEKRKMKQQRYKRPLRGVKTHSTFDVQPTRRSPPPERCARAGEEAEADGDDEDDDEDSDLALMQNEAVDGIDEEKETGAIETYADWRQENRKHLKKRTKNKVDFIANTPANELIYSSRYASGLIPKLQESICMFALKRTPPSSGNCEEILAYLNASFDIGAGAAGFLNFTWKQIADSGVELVDSELQRVLMAKIVMNAISPERCVKDAIQPTLVAVNLYSREATFEIRGLGEDHVVIDVGDIDACLLACASEQARQFITPQVEMYVRAVIPSALEDGNFSHSSLEVLGNF